MSEDPTPKPEQQEARLPPGPGQPPGHRLREARERQGLKLEEVAERLHLQQVQVEALESDDYTRFPAPIFISGYLRGYARLLGLDPESMVKALEQQGLEQPPILSELTAKMPSARRRSLSPRVRMALIAGGAIVLLVIVWLLLRPASIETVEPRDVQQESVAPAPVAGPAVLPAEIPQQQPASEPGSEDEPAEEPPAASNEAMDELVLRFSGESWVEVADVTGRRLAYRMANIFDVLRLRGLAPFDILLGNAPNVSIEYNGKPYENIPISRTNVASFRLGGSSDEGVKKDASQKSDPAT